MSTKENDWFQLEVFNMYDACARAMLREAVVGLGGVMSGQMLVVGMGERGRLGEMLIVRAARDWHIENPRHAPRLLIDVVDSEAGLHVMTIRAKHPFLDQVCEIRPHDTSPDGPAFVNQRIWPGAWRPPDVAFVCLEDEANGLVAADRLRSMLPAAVPIIVQTIERNAGLGSLIRGRGPERLIAVGLEDRVFQLAASLHPVQELLAQAVHQAYFSHRRRQGTVHGPDSPAVRFWEDLEEDHRAASRAQAADLRRKLKMVGCQAVLIPDGLVSLRPFPDEDLERLARDEHERWCEERKSRGWTYGPVRDNGKKIHPNLIPWDDPRLDEATKEIDRNAIRRLPAILAMADYEVVRVDSR